jgi:membrane-bound serine protease (ClpP class)
MQLVDLLWQTLVNPNIAYLLLVAGLWALALAFITPGTGVPEASAVVLLGLAVISLTRLPVNAVGLALIVLSVVLIILELKWPSHGVFIGAGVLMLASGSLFLFRRDETSTRVSLIVVALTVLGTGAFFTFAIGKALAERKRPLAQNPDAVIGETGEAKTDVSAEGTVQVGNELWTAEADEMIPAGTRVQVVRRTGLRLKVVRIGSTGQS